AWRASVRLRKQRQDLPRQRRNARGRYDASGERRSAERIDDGAAERRQIAVPFRGSRHGGEPADALTRTQQIDVAEEEGPVDGDRSAGTGAELMARERLIGVGREIVARVERVNSAVLVAEAFELVRAAPRHDVDLPAGVASVFRAVRVRR